MSDSNEAKAAPLKPVPRLTWLAVALAVVIVAWAIYYFALSQTSQHSGWIRKVRGQKRREDVRGMVVPALRRPEGTLRIRLSIRQLCRVQPERAAHRK